MKESNAYSMSPYYSKKTGKLVAFRIRKYAGLDEFGKPKKFLTTTYRIPDGVKWSDETAKKRADAHAAIWAREQEEKLKHGVFADSKITFSEYATNKLQEKERSGNIKHSTYVRYLDFLKAIEPWLGKMKIVDIKEENINEAINNIRNIGTVEEAAVSLPGVLSSVAPTEKACPELLEEVPKRGGVSKSALSRASGISLYTVKRATKGEPISIKSAEAIATAMGYETERLFNIKRERADLAEKTILEHFRLISAILTDAVKDKLIAQNPAKAADHPKCDTKEADWYSPEDISKLLKILQNEEIYWRAILTVMIYTGARKGEILGLFKSDIDPEKKTLRFSKSLLYSADIGLYIEKTTKNKLNRTVRVPDCVIETLQEYLAWRNKLGIEPSPKWADSDLIFINPKGNPIHPDSVNDYLKKLQKRHNLPHLHPHGFRHTAASTLIYKGADVVSVSKMLGHKDTTTTTKVYAHALQAAAEKNARLLEDAFARNGLDKEAESEKLSAE